MNEKQFNALLCFLGLHKWSFSFYAKHKNFAIGKKCNHCGTWHKEAVKWQLATNKYPI